MGEIGFIVLLVLGYPFFAAWIVGSGRVGRLEKLEREVDDLRRMIRGYPPAPPPAPPPEAAPAPAQAQSAAPGMLYRPVAAPASATVPASVPVRSPSPPSPPPVPVRPPAPPSPPPSPPPRWLLAVKNWLFTGNLVAKLGLVILFIGVGFLLKYVAATVVVPIEVRLAGVVLADLALLGWGWRLRSARREIGLPVQGTAIAILMLVIFGAYQRYGLLPAGFTFALLVVLTVFTCLLAVLQNAFWLAVFGITGGFAAPLLVSTGQGNHVALFSYYALLNAGVFALAVKRSWRTLNLIGFAFSVGVGAAWGWLRYTPDDYLSAQAFLLLFFLFYVGIALAYAHRQQTRLQDYVDATLVLGTPLLAFGLQVGLVRHQAFGIALSALALGAFYLIVALRLWRRGGARWRLLVETFASLGVIFGTLAIPFALDGRWTSGAWALEGAGFVWVGMRRAHRPTWMFGMLLQVGAAIGFLGAATGLENAAARDAHLWLGFVLLGGSAFAVAAGLRRYAVNEGVVARRLADWCLAIAALWLLAGWWTEAMVRTSGGVLANWLAGGAVLVAVLLTVIGLRTAWRVAALLAVAAQVAGAVALAMIVAATWLPFEMLERERGQPLLGAFLIATASFATARMGRTMPMQTGASAGKRAARLEIHPRLASLFLAWASLWWFGPVLNIAAGRAVAWLPAAFGPAQARWMALYALLVAVSAAAGTRLDRRLDWPALRWLGLAPWGMLVLVTLDAMATLYGERRLLEPGRWLAWALLLAGTGDVLRQWTRAGHPPKRFFLQLMHLVRGAGPWCALWPAGAMLVERWLGAAAGGQDAAAAGGWALDAAWGNYLPTWAMMLVLAALLRRSRADVWPTRPLSDWYRSRVVPGGALLILALAALWNLGQDGTMAPLPYLPLLNPLDLSTGFALLLWTHASGAWAVKQRVAGRAAPPWRLRIAILLLAYAWLNAMLLRSAAHYLDIAYRLDTLAASTVVQAMLSLVWSASALIIMRHAAQRAMRRTWGAGALLLGIVVCKLFVVDLAGGGSMARIVSFVGAGLLMLLIGYVAPYPKASEGKTSPHAGI